MKEAVNIMKQHHRSANEPTDQTPPLAINQAQVVEQEPQEPDETEPEAVDEAPEPPSSFGDKTEQLLSDILDQLKTMQRAEMFGEFSIMRLLAGLLQITVLLCLLIAIWFLMSSNKQDNSVPIALGFAAVLQLMSLTFYIMQGRK